MACTTCNSVKGDQLVEVNDLLWLDRDNTFLAFTYTNEGFVALADDLSITQQPPAQALLDLVGLQRHQASGWPNPTKRDKRWQQREEAWAVAELCKKRFDDLAQAPEARDLVLEAAKAHGFFSVRMTVFAHDPEIKQGLIQIFPGTAPTCFDSNGNPLNRLNGVI